MVALKTDVPRVYSYLRYSSTPQDWGDSERRQIAKTQAYAQDKGMPLDDSLQMADKGVSAFRGKNRRVGALAGFLRDVEAARVPRGSILVIENVDRLSREPPLTALKITTAIIEAGVSIQTLMPYSLYNEESVNHGLIQQLVGQIDRAYQESLYKSQRVREARETARRKARENGEVLTRRCPAWLTVLDGQFAPIPEAVKTIHTIFKRKLSGIGVRQIALRLNAEADCWTPPPRQEQKTRGWRASYIRKILGNEALIGRYQPFTVVEKKRDGKTFVVREPVGDVIDGYYPQVIDAGQFYAAQAQLSANKGMGGQTGKFTNILRHLVVCGYCQSPLHFIDTGKPPKGGKYLACDNQRRGLGCSCARVRYEEVETCVVENCKGLRPEQILPDPDEQARLVESLRQRIAGDEALAQEIQNQIDNLIDTVARTNTVSVRDSYEAKILKLQQEKMAAEQTIEAERRELHHAELGLRSFERWQSDLAGLQKALAKKEDIALRQRLNAHLRQIIAKVEIYSQGFASTFDDHLTEELYEMTDDPEPAFVRYVREQRQSRRGRFYRIHFVSKRWIDVVPEGSIASGLKLYVDEDGQGWERIAPSWQMLYDEWQAAE